MKLQVTLLITILLVGLCCSKLLTPKSKHLKYKNTVHLPNGLIQQSCNNITFEQSSGVQAGYISVSDAQTSFLHYTFYPVRGGKSPSTTPIFVWLNGGPGCSSQEGAFKELGPYRLQFQNGKWVPQAIQGSWNDLVNLLVIDQPIGTGFSYKDPKDAFVDNSELVGTQFAYAINSLFNLKLTNCDYSPFRANELHIFGESFAGHYIPGIAAGIYNWNQIATNKKINLQGIGIGDGWTYPQKQLSEYSTYAYALSLIDDATKQQCDWNILIASQLIEAKDYISAQPYMDTILGPIVQASGNCDVYNVYHCPAFEDSSLETFLNYDDVKTQFGVPSAISFQECNGDVYNGFAYDFMKSYHTFITQSLDLFNYKVLLYNGQVDLIVNTPGALRWISELSFKNSTDWRASPYNVWNYNGSIAGYIKNQGNFTFALVNNAGHMVPQDQPAFSLDLINRYLNNRWN